MSRQPPEAKAGLNPEATGIFQKKLFTFGEKRCLFFVPKRHLNAPLVPGLRFQSRSRQRQGKPGEEELGNWSDGVAGNGNLQSCALLFSNTPTLHYSITHPKTCLFV